VSHATTSTDLARDDDKSAEAGIETTPDRRGFVRTTILGQKQALIGLIIVLVFVLIAIFAPLLAPYSPTEKTGGIYEAPSSAHWLGTDDGGVDMLSLMIYGSRVSLEVGFAAAIVAMVIGVLLWTSTARVLRAQVKSVRERVYVKRARSIGAGNNRLVFKHVLPQVAPLLIANTVLMIALAVFLETYIAFLGLGDPSTISWGKLIENSFLGNAVLNNAWWAVVPPGLAVTVVILACTMVGQSMEDALNPRLKVGHLAVRRFRMRSLHGKLESE